MHKTEDFPFRLTDEEKAVIIAYRKANSVERELIRKGLCLPMNISEDTDKGKIIPFPAVGKEGVKKDP